MTVVEKKLNVRVAADVKEKLVAEAGERGLSVNDVAVGILAGIFRVRFEGTSRKSPGASLGEGALVLRMPHTLYKKIHAAAIDVSKVELVNQKLREHYGLVEAAAAA
jgi:hypothetical protein